MGILDVKILDKIVKDTVVAVEKSKAQIFDIYEAARNESESVKYEVERVKRDTADIIFKVDELEKSERHSRLKLMEVSRNFGDYLETDIKSAYDDAKNLQIQLTLCRAHEQNLRRQRDELELRLKALKNMVDKAEDLVAHVGVVLDYLGNQMGGVANQIETLQHSQIFGSKIIKAQEEERRRVARDIHDGPAQAMANLVFRAEVCERLIDIDMARAKTELKDLREQVRMCLQETRKIIFDLRPMTLDDLGLVPTVKRLSDTMRDRSGISFEVRVIGEERRLDSHVEIGMFRIVQEALNNVEKHSGASLVEVILEFRSDFIAATVSDNGQGFDYADNVGCESFGLLGMRERMNLLKGEVVFKSEIGKGTKVMIKVPL